MAFPAPKMRSGALFLELIHTPLCSESRRKFVTDLSFCERDMTHNEKYAVL